jgi:hypothetical protein
LSFSRTPLAIAVPSTFWATIAVYEKEREGCERRESESFDLEKVVDVKKVPRCCTKEEDR